MQRLQSIEREIALFTLAGTEEKKMIEGVGESTNEATNHENFSRKQKSKLGRFSILIKIQSAGRQVELIEKSCKENKSKQSCSIMKAIGHE